MGSFTLKTIDTINNKRNNPKITYRLLIKNKTKEKTNIIINNKLFKNIINQILII